MSRVRGLAPVRASPSGVYPAWGRSSWPGVGKAVGELMGCTQGRELDARVRLAFRGFSC